MFRAIFLIDFFKGRAKEPQAKKKVVQTLDRRRTTFSFRVLGVSHFGSHSARVMMARRDRRLPSRAPRVLALALLIAASVAGAAAEATKWTPAEFERSLFATRGSRRKDPDVTPTPHLLKLYAPWCGHCARMAPAFDEAAAALRLRGMEVGKLDCADRARGGAEFCGRLNVRGFPQVKLFLGTEDAAVDFPMSGGDRSSAALVSFALAGHAARPRQYFREARVRESTAEDAHDADARSSEAGEEAGGETDDSSRDFRDVRSTLALVPKTGLERWRDFATDAALDVVEDVIRCLTDHRLGSLTIFATAFFVALFGIVITDLVSERMGVPRRGESWDDMRARADWETERARRMEKRKEKKAE